MRSVLALLMVTGCWVDDRSVAEPEPPDQDSVEVFDIPVFVGPKFDVLFVIDSSPAIARYEAQLAAELPRFADVLGWRSDDLHVGVITSDLGGDGCPARGDEGALRTTADLVGAPFLIDWRHLDDTRSANFPGELAEVLPRLASVGHAGCPRAQPLAAIKRALANHPRNQGFRRDEAYLLIIVISAGDDASALPVDDLVAFLDQHAPAQRRVLVAGIHAGPAPRLEALAAGFPDRSSITPIATPDLAYAALQVTGSFGSGWYGERCIEGRFDLEPAVPGIQHDCSVSDVVLDGETRVYDRVLPACDATSSIRPCWRIEQDQQNCPFASGLVVRVDRRDYPPEGTHVIGHCVTARE